MPFVFGLTLFVSATLLFLVQPMIGKMILPRLGGTPAVWATCMVFFQAALLAGYAYAHAATNWLGSRRQAVLHLLLLALPLLVLPIAVSDALIPPGDANPIPWLLGILVLTAGLPFFVVATSAPLLQRWFADTGHPLAKDPYFLYAASNVGSMLALVGYPTMVEPHLRLADQANLWRWGYCLLAALTAACAYCLLRAPTPLLAEQHVLTASSPAQAAGKPSWGQRLHWVALAFVPSSLMLGVTNYITTDIAAIPLLWVIPLALYLLSFILVFAQMPPWLDKLILLALLAALGYTAGTYLNPEQYYLTALTGGKALVSGKALKALLLVAPAAGLILLLPRFPPLLHRAMVLLLPVAILLLVFLIRTERTSADRSGIMVLIGLHLTVLFMTAMVCHGELALSRPAPRYLTGFYLWMSLGGVLGGAFNALAAPLLFTTLAEYPLAMVLACLLLPNLAGDKPSSRFTLADLGQTVLPAMLGIAFLIMGRNSQLLQPARLTAVAASLGPRTVLLAAALLLALLVYLFHSQSERRLRGIDVAAAAALGLLAVGLALGVPAKDVGLEALSERLGIKHKELEKSIIWGLPILMAYTLIGRPVRFGLGVGAVLLAGAFVDSLTSQSVYRVRSFFGVLSVKHYSGDNSNSLVHGTTLHGEQFMDPDKQDQALTYYHVTGPVGKIFALLNGSEREKEIALIGLGTGTLTSYGKPGQKLTIYEIDKAIVTIACETGYFTYFQRSKADKEIILGDARLRIREAADGRYGLIVVDAFSSDAIPIHLITKEALELYLQKLRSDGLVAFHISNRYLNLKPVLANLAQELGLVARVMEDGDEVDGEEVPGKSASTWVVVARREADLGSLLEDEAWMPLQTDPKVGIWTDDYSNLLSVFNP